MLTAGILVEGFTSVIASMVGTGTGLSSFRDNVSGVLGVTKVDSILLPPYCLSQSVLTSFVSAGLLAMLWISFYEIFGMNKSVCSVNVTQCIVVVVIWIHDDNLSK